MKLYILIRQETTGYDEYDSMVIRASSEQSARKMANAHCGDEGKMWTDSTRALCKPVSQTGTAKIVLQSFNVG